MKLFNQRQIKSLMGLVFLTTPLALVGNAITPETANAGVRDRIENGISNVKEDAPRCIKEGTAGAGMGAALGAANPAGGPAGGAIAGGAAGATNCAVREETGKTLPQHGANAIDKGANAIDDAESKAKDTVDEFNPF